MKTIQPFLRASFIFALLALAGCGSAASSACDKAEECAIKAGDAFSHTECETKAISAREKADSVKCGAEFDEVANCASALACGSNGSDLEANCGAQLKALDKCVMP